MQSRSALFALAALVLLAGVPHAVPSPGMTAFVQVPLQVKGMEPEVVEALGTAFAESIQRAGGFDRVTTRRDVADLLRLARDQQLIGCDENAAACEAELAGALGVSHLVTFDVTRLDKTYLANATLIDARTTKQLFRGTRPVPSLDAALVVIDELARKLVGSLAGPTADSATVAAQAAAVAAEKRQKLEQLREETERRSRDAERARLEALARDTSDMVLVPSGEFYAGCNSPVDSDCLENEKPGRKVDLPAFKIDRLEVTHAEYRACVEAGLCDDPPESSPGCIYGEWFSDLRPMNCVTWQEATRFCAFRHKRLPTAMEWEKAARGLDGRRFPWGNDLVADAAQLAPDASGTCDVGTHPAGASPFGMLDASGNVAEWTASTYDQQRYEQRGGGYFSTGRFARTSDRHRADGGSRKPDLGFRCAL